MEEFTPLQVPKDAWSLDMAFSDSGDLAGGFSDSNSGVDYHVPVSGSPAQAPRLRIAHVSVEMAPIAKVSTGAALCRLMLPRDCHPILHLMSKWKL